MFQLKVHADDFFFLNFQIFSLPRILVMFSSLAEKQWFVQMTNSLISFVSICSIITVTKYTWQHIMNLSSGLYLRQTSLPLHLSKIYVANG